MLWVFNFLFFADIKYTKCSLATDQAVSREDH